MVGGGGAWESISLRVTVAVVCQHSVAVCGYSFVVKMQCHPFSQSSQFLHPGFRLLPHPLAQRLSSLSVQLLISLESSTSPSPSAPSHQHLPTTTNGLSSKSPCPPSCGGQVGTAGHYLLGSWYHWFRQYHSSLFSHFFLVSSCVGVPLGSLLIPHLLMCSSIHVASITTSYGLNCVPQKFMC